MASDYMTAVSLFLLLAISLLQAESNVKPIWLTKVTCTSDSDAFSQCNHGIEPVGYGYCSSSNIVAITCGMSVCTCLYVLVNVQCRGIYGCKPSRPRGRSPRGRCGLQP